MLESLGDWLFNLGMAILPYSFFAYLPYRWFEYLVNKGYTHTSKSIWYLALGILYLTDSVHVDYVVMFICFIEFWDHFIRQFEVNRERKIEGNVGSKSKGA